jgi:hypothetical protein
VSMRLPQHVVKGTLAGVVGPTARNTGVIWFWTFGPPLTYY